MSRALLLLLLLLIVPSTIVAQDPNVGRNDYKIRRWVEPLKDRPAGTAAFSRNIESLTQHLATLPAFTSPAEEMCHAVEPQVQAPLAGLHDYPRAFVSVTVYAWHRVACRVDAYAILGAVHMIVNDPREFLAGSGDNDAEGRFGRWQGALPGGGITQYDTRTVVAHKDMPRLFVPISRERHLRYLIAEAEKDLKESQAREARANTRVADMRQAPTYAEQYEKWLREGKPKAKADYERSLEALRKIGRPESEIAKTREQMAAALVKQEEFWQKMVAAEKARGPQPPVGIGVAGELGKRTADRAREDEALRAALAALSPAQRREPACKPPVIQQAREDCGPGITLVAVNPALPRPASQALRLIVIEKPTLKPALPLWEALRDGTFLEPLVNQ